MGIRCSCFSRFERSLEYSDDSATATPPPEPIVRPQRHSGDRARSGALSTILETSERESSNGKKSSSEASRPQSRRRSSDQRRSEERRSGERRSDDFRRLGEQRRSADDASGSDSAQDTQPVDDLTMISQILSARRRHTPDQVNRFMALLNADPGHTPSPFINRPLPQCLEATESARRAMLTPKVVKK